jgi:hypothetical protein
VFVGGGLAAALADNQIKTGAGGAGGDNPGDTATGGVGGNGGHSFCVFAVTPGAVVLSGGALDPGSGGAPGTGTASGLEGEAGQKNF